MAISTLVSTAGLSNANSYCSLAVANQYHEDRPADEAGTWDLADDDEKTKALLWATQLLDSLYEWYGYVSTDVQGLLWPRTGLMKKNGWASLSTTEVPVEIQRATAEFARSLMVEDRAADSDIETQGIQALGVGDISIKFKDNVSAKVVPDVVTMLIPREWGYLRGSSGVRRAVRA